MATHYPTQTHKVKCPHCGWIRTVSVPVLADESLADIAKGGPGAAGALERLTEAARSIVRGLAGAGAPAPSGWVDMPACPECGNVYQYNIYTQETRP
jgi:hypothetical protein